MKWSTPLPVMNSIMSVKKKPSIASLPFQFSAELVNPQLQGKKFVFFFHKVIEIFVAKKILVAL